MEARQGREGESFPGLLPIKSAARGIEIFFRGLLRRRPRPVLGHGLASGDVRFRPSTRPTVNWSSMSAPIADVRRGKTDDKLAVR